MIDFKEFQFADASPEVFQLAAFGIRGGGLRGPENPDEIRGGTRSCSRALFLINVGILCGLIGLLVYRQVHRKNA